jgi:hypothetical protein
MPRSQSIEYIKESKEEMLRPQLIYSNSRAPSLCSLNKTGESFIRMAEIDRRMIQRGYSGREQVAAEVNG